MKSFITVFILLASTLISAQNDYKTYNHSAGFQIVTGVTSFNLSEAKARPDFLPDYFKKDENTKLYPMNFLWGGGLYYFPYHDLSLFLGLEYSNTRAYSQYREESVIYGFKSDISFISVYSGIKKHFMEIPVVQPFAGVQWGYMVGEFNGSTYHNIYANPYGFFVKTQENLSFSNFIAECFIGLSYNLNFVILDIQGGYRYSKAAKEDLRYFPDFTGDINTSGTNVKLSFRTGVYW